MAKGDQVDNLEDGRTLALRDDKNGFIVGMVRIKEDGKVLLIQSVKKPYTRDENAVEIDGPAPYLSFSEEAGVNHGGSEPGMVGNYGPSGAHTLSINARADYEELGSYSSTVNLRDNPKSVSPRGEILNTFDLSAGKKYSSDGCGKKTEAKKGPAGRRPAPAVGM